MFKTIIACIAFVAILNGCKEKIATVDPPAEEEVITTVTLSLTQVGTSAVTVFVWEDIDGVGGNPPNRIDTFRVLKDVQYTGVVKIENRAKTPPEDYTAEIRGLATQHQFFFATADEILAIDATDTDSNGLPLGLTFSALGKQYGTSHLQVSLSHYESPSSKDGNTPGDETDISVTFPLRVE